MRSRMLTALALTGLLLGEDLAIAGEMPRMTARPSAAADSTIEASATPVVRRRVVRHRVVRQRVVRRHHRSWKKTALVIGGSTAAGAGIGALAGGEKGALVGAAAGGAAGTVYEVHKRRRRRRG